METALVFPPIHRIKIMDKKIAIIIAVAIGVAGVVGWLAAGRPGGAGTALVAASKAAVNISPDMYDAYEGGTARFGVTVSGLIPHGGVNVGVRVGSIEATYGSDFTVSPQPGVSGTVSLHFTAEETQYITVNALADDLREAERELIYLEVQASATYTIEGNSKVHCELLDTDVPHLTFSRSITEINEGESGNVVLTLLWDENSLDGTLVSYQLTGTAQDGVDYYGDDEGTVFFPPPDGQYILQQTVVIDTIDDDIEEGEENIFFQVIPDEENYRIYSGPGTRTFNILASDPADENPETEPEEEGENEEENPGDGGQADDETNDDANASPDGTEDQSGGQNQGDQESAPDSGSTIEDDDTQKSDTRNDDKDYSANAGDNDNASNSTVEGSANNDDSDETLVELAAGELIGIPDGPALSDRTSVTGSPGSTPLLPASTVIIISITLASGGVAVVYLYRRTIWEFIHRHLWRQ